MLNLLIPGRHIITTAFQEKYLGEILSREISELPLINRRKFKDKKVGKLIFAITSANQDNSRYNPVSVKERLLGAERLCQSLRGSFSFRYSLFSIPHYSNVNNFPEIINKEIEAQTSGDMQLTPKNTIVFCSTPYLIDKYKKMGFAILTGEYSIKKKKYLEKTPSVIMNDIFENYKVKKKYEKALKYLSGANLSLWEDFGYIPKKIARIWSDPLLTEKGGLTETRDYATYTSGMSNPEAIRFKYDEIQGLIKEGKIVDEGCADGALLSLISKDFPDSDLMGLELTSEFLALCYERMRQGHFGGNFIHFHQRNLLNKVFENNTIDTTICNSTAHEIWSYGQGRKSLISYLKNKYSQLRKGGRLIIRDVVGPENSSKIVHMKLSKKDGINKIRKRKSLSNKALSKYLGALSTHARFLVFAEDYLNMESSKKMNSGRKIKYTLKELNGEEYVKLSLRDACEFMSKKDYIDNWRSELNEEFAFWAFSNWRSELEKIGFNVLVGKDESRAYVNDWIVKNRLTGKVELFDLKNGKLIQKDFPVSNIILVAEKK